MGLLRWGGPRVARVVPVQHRSPLLSALCQLFLCSNWGFAHCLDVTGESSRVCMCVPLCSAAAGDGG